MDTALNVIQIVVVAAILDWLFFTRVGGWFYGEFDYRYWPLSKARLLSFGSLVCTVVGLFLFGPKPNPDDPPMWALIPFGCVLIFHIIVGYRDMAIQRRVGYRRPPRYVDTDEY